MEQLRKFIAFSWAEKHLLLQAALLVGCIRLGLAVLPFGTVQRVLNRSSKSLHKPPVQDVTYLGKVIRAVRAVARHTLGDKPCLVQALAAQWLLKRAGLSTELRIGVTKESSEQLLAHAWLEYEGDIVLGGRSSTWRYTTLKSVPGS